jgi:hypothetical protein
LLQLRQAARIFFVTSLSITVAAVPTSATLADDTDWNFNSVVTTFDASDIESAKISEKAVPSAGPDVTLFAQEHVESESRAGRKVSLDDVQVAVLNESSKGEVLVAWDGRSAPDRIAISEVSNQEDQGSTAVGIRWPGSEESVERSSSSSSGVGYQAAVDVEGFEEVVKDQCATIRFSPHYDADSDHLLRTCHEKFHQEGTVNWVYNRYSSFLPASPESSGVRAQIVDFTIRSIPWEGETGRVAGIGEHTRGGNDEDCTPGEFAFSFGGASLKVPVGSCNGTQSLPNDDYNSMGAMWSGHSDTQKHVDAAVAVRSVDAEIEPIYADYDWVEIVTCGRIPGVPCSTSLPSFQHDYLIHTDSGWHWPGS